LVHLGEKGFSHTPTRAINAPVRKNQLIQVKVTKKGEEDLKNISRSSKKGHAN
jgi:RNA-binding protein YhbY